MKDGKRINDNGQLTMDNKNKYKKTEIGEIPVEWEVRKLEEISDKVGDGLHGTPTYNENGQYYFINGNNLINGKILITDETKKVNESEYLKYKKDLNERTLLISLNGTIGNLAYYNFEKIVLGKSCGYIVLKNIVNKEYIYYALNNQKVQFYFFKQLTGTTIKNLSLNALRNTPIVVPPLQEQQKIATILSTVDKYIEQTDALIEKTKELKKGLMQKLLTKGIGHTEFKKTEIGEIPKEWEVKKLVEVVDSNKKNSFTDGDWIEADYITDSGIRLIQTGNIGIGNYIEKEDKKYISEKTFIELKCKEVEPGDILICRMAEPTGRSCIVPDLNCKMITSVDCTILKVDKSKFDNKYINYFLNTLDNLKRITKFEQGSTRKRITRTNLGKTEIPIPPLKEQQKIASILSEVDNKIQQYELKKEKLQNLKKGLMQKFLTGKIRVKV